jgi:DNA-binding transcriptional LysR family regulator
MSAFDHSDLDGRLLQLLLAVVEERSVTRAASAWASRSRPSATCWTSCAASSATRCSCAPAAASCPRRGPTRWPCARACCWKDLRAFATAGGFDPATLQATITIAANDLQRDLLLPPLLRACARRRRAWRCASSPSGVPSAEMLRERPVPAGHQPAPAGRADIVQKRLFEDRYAVFYDASGAPAPRTR